MNLESLKENSIRINGNGTVVCWPQCDNEEILDMTDVAVMFNGCYAMNNGIVCFVSDNVVYVTPYTREAQEALRVAGMGRADFCVPFSNSDYPKYEKAKWRRLRELATESYYCDYEVDAAEWCDKYGIGELSKETMERCFRIPRSGVAISHPDMSDIIYPACRDERCVDCIVTEKLGLYCTNNSRVVFIYRDGHTYVTKGYGIIDELRRAGYARGELFVPFSNGERITDPCLAAQWDAIK